MKTIYPRYTYQLKDAPDGDCWSIGYWVRLSGEFVEVEEFVGDAADLDERVDELNAQSDRMRERAEAEAEDAHRERLREGGAM